MFLLKKKNDITLSSNDDKRMQLFHSVETYAYGTSKNLICKKKAKWKNIIKQCKKWLTLMLLPNKKHKKT